MAAETASETGSAASSSPPPPATAAATAMSGMGKVPTEGIATANQRVLVPPRSFSRRSCATTVRVGAPSAGKVGLWPTTSPRKTCCSGSGAYPSDSESSRSSARSG